MSKQSEEKVPEAPQPREPSEPVGQPVAKKPYKPPIIKSWRRGANRLRPQRGGLSRSD